MSSATATRMAILAASISASLTLRCGSTFVAPCRLLKRSHQGESLLMALKEVALSSGSACTSASLEPSYVLRALGAAEDMAHSSLRFGMGRFTTEAEVDFVIARIVAVVTRLREMRCVLSYDFPPSSVLTLGFIFCSPLWEMVQEGIDISSIDWSQH